MKREDREERNREIEGQDEKKKENYRYWGKKASTEPPLQSQATHTAGWRWLVGWQSKCGGGMTKRVRESAN